MEVASKLQEVMPPKESSGEIGLKSVVDIVKDIGDLGQDGTPQAPPSTPTNLKGPTSVGDAPEAIAQDDSSSKEEKKEATTYNAFPRFEVTWDVSEPAKASHGPHVGPTKSHEMSPEATLVEFISTSASFYDVKRQDIKNLEWDILKVFTNNIMPANAAAWYMAKRRFYLDKPWLLQLLPYTLKHYPKKFVVNNDKKTVDFVEIYTKEVARKKMQYLVHQGLFAYFSHKADEYGVYFFDPLYYESTEPFHANLRLVTNSHSTHRSKLIHTYFNKFKSQFYFTQHSSCLVSISKSKPEIVTNNIGVITSMINNSYGIIQFHNGTTSEKAIFCARSLYKDGYLVDKDPMRLPPIQFDGYKIQGDPKSEGKEYSWYAVLVWVGKKPSPKFNATREMLNNTQFFQTQPVTYAQLAGLAAPPVSFEQLASASAPPQVKDDKLDDCMRVGEVVTIQKNGAVVLMHKNSGSMAFIPGWAFRLARQRGTYLTTTQGVSLAMGDIIAFYIEPKVEAAPFSNVGCNVMVLKHANSGNQAVKVAEGEVAAKTKTEKGKRNKKSKKTDDEASASSSGEKPASRAKGRKSGRGQRRKSNRLNSLASETSVEGGRRKTLSERSKYREFLLSAELVPEEEYDSDVDPTFIPPPIFELDFDYDEYSDGEIQNEEEELLLRESKLELNDEEVVVVAQEEVSGVDDDKAESATDEKKVKEPKYIAFLLKADVVPSDDESDREYHLPAGIQHLVAKPSVEEEVEKEEGEKPDEEEVDEEELLELTEEAKLFIGPELYQELVDKLKADEASKPAEADCAEEEVAKPL